MMWIIYVGLLIVILVFNYKIYKRAIDAEVHSSEHWFRERLPFSGKTINQQLHQKRKESDARTKAEYDPEADYESVEVFYKEKTK